MPRRRQLFYTGVVLVRSEAAAQAGTAMMKEGLEMSRRLGDEGLIAEVLANLSQAAEWMGDRVEAVRYAEEALEIGRSLGDDRLIGIALGALGLAVSERAKKKASPYPGAGPPAASRRPFGLLLVAHQPGCTRARR